MYDFSSHSTFTHHNIPFEKQKALKKMTVDNLKQALRVFHLLVSGNKSALIERIMRQEGY